MESLGPLPTPRSTQARKKVRQARARRTVAAANALFAIVLVAALWCMVNYLAGRHYLRADWSRQRMTSLSEMTLTLLKDLDRPVRLVLFAGPSFRAADELNDLLSEYKLRSPLVSVERVDPDRDLAKVEKVRAEFDLQEPGWLVVVAGDRFHKVDLKDMVMLEQGEPIPGKPRRMVAFRGEALVSGAMLRVTRLERPVVYFLTGHGEKDVDVHEKSLQGYSMIRERLEQGNLEVQRLNLDQTQAVPTNCAVLVIAGPQSRISQPEVDLLREYLENKGSLMVLLDTLADAGLGPLLKEWGVQLINDVVVDPRRTITGADVHVADYASHPVTRNLKGVQTVFIRPRSVLPSSEASTEADKPVYTAVAASSSESWAELTLDEDPIRFDASIDQLGPIPIVAVVEKGASDVQVATRPTRLMVVGDSDFAGNWLQSGGGMRLFQNGVQWLMNREDQISIPPKTVEEIRLELNRTGLNRLLLAVAAGMPLGVAFLGGLVWLRRRR